MALMQETITSSLCCAPAPALPASSHALAPSVPPHEAWQCQRGCSWALVAALVHQPVAWVHQALPLQLSQVQALEAVPWGELCVLTGSSGAVLWQVLWLSCQEVQVSWTALPTGPRCFHCGVLRKSCCGQHHETHAQK